jgi:2-aminomuconate deaminase
MMRGTGQFGVRSIRGPLLTPKNNSVTKAFTILRALAAGGQDMTATELARAVSGNLATIHRFLVTLEGEGAVARGRDGGFHLGPALADLGGRVEGDTLLVNAAQAHLEALAEEFREAVHCVVRSGSQAINAAVAKPDRSLLIAHTVGEPFPLHCTSAGKLFLATMSESRRGAFLASATLERFTPATFTHPVALERELKKVREDKFAVDNEEWEEGLRSLAVPLHNARGQVVAAIEISAPISRFDDDKLAAARIAIDARIELIERSMAVESKTFFSKAKPRGNYPHLKRVGDFIFLSGTSARRPDDSFEGAAVDTSGAVTIDIAKQARYTLDKIADMLNAVGASLADVVDMQVHLTDIADYDAFNAVYAGYFGADGPTRSTVAVKQLPHPHQALMLTAVVYKPGSQFAA